MGLDTTHGCFSGGYGGFMNWRTAVAATIGMDLTRMEGYAASAPRIPFPDPETEPLIYLLDHSDCDGDLPPGVLVPLAERLEAIAPQLADDLFVRDKSFRQIALEFAAGCREAASRGEPVEFR